MTILFEDRFETGTLDRSKWNVEGPAFWVNREVQAYIDTPETVAVLSEGAVDGATGGVLALRPQYKAGFETPTGRTTDFVSGRVNSFGKFDFTYGRVTARLKLPAAEGVWPAFWLLGNSAWPATGEIDIMEYVGETDWIGVAVHGEDYCGDTPLVTKYFFDGDTDATDWHEYAVEWTDDRILFFVDGRLVYRVTRPMVLAYGDWAFDTPKHLILNFALGGEYPLKTNGLKTPYTGLPVATAERIKTDDIAMYIDWVRVESFNGSD